jgi:hypothetical protein
VKRDTAPIICIIAVLCVILCGSLHSASKGNSGGRGATQTLYSEASRPPRNHGKVKACFVRMVKPSERIYPHRIANAKKAFVFLVDTAQEILLCATSKKAGGASLLRNMQRGTPIVMKGTLQEPPRIFIVDKLMQGWGKEQLEGNW